MDNLFGIKKLASQLKEVAGRIENLADDMRLVASKSPEILETYDSLLLDEINHTQILTLEMTRIVADKDEDEESIPRSTSGDDTAFMPGELNSPIKDTGDTKHPESGRKQAKGVA